MPEPTLLIGVGNEFRSDDGAGCLIVRELAKRNLPGCRSAEATGEGAALIQLWEGEQRVYLFDAVSSGAEPGTIFRIDVHSEPLPGGFFHYSTHAFSVAEAVELSRTLETLPPNFIVYGIEGERFEAGLGLQPRILAAVYEVIKRVEQEVGKPGLSAE